MRTTVLICAVAILASVCTPANAQTQEGACRVSGADLEADLVTNAKRIVPQNLQQTLQSDDLFKAQVYGYLVGRRLATAPVGSPYRGCTLALDAWLTASFGRFSNEVLTTYRAGLVGQFDVLMEGVYGLDTRSWDRQALDTQAPLADETSMTLSAASEKVCPTTYAQEYSPAWRLFDRWLRQEYRGDSDPNLPPRRWEELRVILGHALARVNQAVGDHPVRQAAFACLSGQAQALIDRVASSNQRFVALREQNVVRDAFEGNRDDEVKAYTGVVSKATPWNYWAWLQQDTGVSLRDGSFRAAPDGPPDRPRPPDPVPPTPPVREDPLKSPTWPATCAAAIRDSPGLKPEFARINTTSSDTRVYIAPVANVHVYLEGGRCVPWDWNEFRREWNELDTEYPRTGGYYKIVNYKHRTRNEWTRIGYYR